MYLEEINFQGIVNNAGEMIGGVFDRHNEEKWSAPECGKRPFFIGRRRNEWEKCRAQSMQRTQMNQMPVAAPVRKQNFFAQNKTPLLIGGGVLAAVLIYKALK